jgi:hypothetical protein
MTHHVYYDDGTDWEAKNLPGNLDTSKMLMVGPLEISHPSVH